MRLGSNGRYQQITIKIADDIPEDSCDIVLDNLKVSEEMLSFWQSKMREL